MSHLRSRAAIPLALSLRLRDLSALHGREPLGGYLQSHHLDLPRLRSDQQLLRPLSNVPTSPRSCSPPRSSHYLAPPAYGGKAGKMNAGLRPVMGDLTPRFRDDPALRGMSARPVTDGSSPDESQSRSDRSHEMTARSVGSSWSWVSQPWVSPRAHRSRVWPRAPGGSPRGGYARHTGGCFSPTVGVPGSRGCPPTVGVPAR